MKVKRLAGDQQKGWFGMSKTMKAAVFEGNGVFCVKEVPVPSPAAKEVLVKIEAGSICGSDLHVLSVPPGQYAKPGTILGHEFLGHIEELGEGVTTVKKGDRVIIEPIEIGRAHV